MHTLTQKTNGCVLIDGQPFQAGDLVVKFITGGIRLLNKFNPADTILEDLYSNITDPSTGIAFVSSNALQLFALQNFFVDAPVKGGSISSGVSVADYATMLTLATGNQAIIFHVANDENKGRLDSVYIYFPSAGLFWVMANQEQ